MSHTLWLELSGGAANAGAERDNSIMLRLGGELDAMASRLGVTPLSAFHDHSAIAREYASELGDLEEAVLRPPEWHDPADGIRSLDAIIHELRARPESLGFMPTASQRHWPDTLMRDLEYCRARLADAASRGSRFRLLVVP